MSRKITLTDIAEKAGVSRATVSYVLNGKKKVSKDVADKVLEIAKSFNYRNAETDQLSRKLGRLIGFLVLPNSVNPEEDTFSFCIQYGIDSHIEEKGYFLLYKRLEKLDVQDRYLLDFLDSVEGLIIMNPRDDDAYRDFITYIREKGLRYVLIGTPDDENTFYLDMDVESAAYQASHLLLSKGCRNIVYIDTPIGMKQSTQIIRGYSLSLEERHLVWDSGNLVYVDTVSIEEGMHIAEKIIKERKNTDGFITPNEVLARGVLITLQRLGWAVPEKCKVVSLGGGSISGKLSYPLISAIDYNPKMMGVKAAKMLLEIMSRKRIKPTHILFPAVIKERETT